MKDIGTSGRARNGENFGCGRVDEDFVGLVFGSDGSRLGVQAHFASEFGLFFGCQLQAQGAVDIGRVDAEAAGFQVRVGHHGSVRVRDLNGLNGERLVAVLGKHADDLVEDNVGLVDVGRGGFDKHVAGLAGNDAGELRVDDGRERADTFLGVQDDGVDGGRADDVEVFANVAVGLREHNVHRRNTARRKIVRTPEVYQTSGSPSHRSVSPTSKCFMIPCPSNCFPSPRNGSNTGISSGFLAS